MGTGNGTEGVGNAGVNDSRRQEIGTFLTKRFEEARDTDVKVMKRRKYCSSTM